MTTHSCILTGVSDVIGGQEDSAQVFANKSRVIQGWKSLILPYVNISSLYLHSELWIDDDAPTQNHRDFPLNSGIWFAATTTIVETRTTHLIQAGITRFFAYEATIALAKIIC